MEFEGQYLTYDDYIDLGGTLDEEPFNLLEFEVRKIIDRRTQRRLIGVEKMPQDVLVCMYKMINTVNSYLSSTSVDTMNGANQNIASENIDGYSVSYVTTDQILEKAPNIIKSKNAELEDIMLNYLYGVIVNGQAIIYNGAI